MVYKWQPWTQYCAGAVVQYDGGLWKIVQPHQSEPNWQPPNVPALWTRLPEEACDDYHSGNKPHCVEEHHQSQAPRPQNQPQPGGWGDHHDDHKQQEQRPQEQRPQEQQRLQEQQKPQEQKPQQQKPDDDDWLTEKRKHELEIGGGIVGALAIGAGVYAYSRHESDEQEEAKKAAWRAEGTGSNWAAGAQVRTDHYRQGGSGPPVQWHFVRRGESIPQNALVGGHEHGDSLYFARAHVEGQLLVGKAGKHLNNGSGGASVACDGREIAVDEFEVLVGEEHSIRWVNHHMQSGPLRVSGWQPVEGGRDSSGKFVFVTQMRHEGGVHPGRYIENDRCAFFAWGGGMVEASEFNVLAYK